MKIRLFTNLFDCLNAKMKPGEYYIASLDDSFEISQSGYKYHLCVVDNLDRAIRIVWLLESLNQNILN